MSSCASLSSRARLLFATVPLVLMSTIAMTLNLAAPADAATLAKRAPKPKGAVPAPTPKAELRAGVSSAASAPTHYVVVEGDTVSGVAGRFGLSTASVLAVNGLGWSALIFPGQVLTLSTSAAPLVAAPAPTPVSAELSRYTVVAGDTISGIAAAHGLPTTAVLNANGLDAHSIIFPGRTIVLPDAAATTGGAPVAPVAPVSAAPAPESPELAASRGFATGATHTIAAGETISAVAASAGVSVQAVLDANGLGWSSIIYPGQVLVIPDGSASAAGASESPGAVASPAVPATLVPESAVFISQSTPTPTPLTPVTLTDEMRRNAATIVAVGREAGVSDEGLVVALAAAAQESGLRNLDHGDRDSLGLFQQRPSTGWGSPEQLMDPVRASQAFFGGAGNPNPGITRGLLDIPGWESLSVTQAAQAVQRSAFPDHYAKWEASARAWLGEL
jgi:N-acetylmuramoyl-L-alanine amidase